MQVFEKDANSGECMANTLGNAAIVETSDGQIVLLQRSGNVGECHNVSWDSSLTVGVQHSLRLHLTQAVVLPGGHAEPERIGIKSVPDWNEMNEKGTVPTEDDVGCLSVLFPGTDARTTQVVSELWNASLEEVAEATGILPSEVEEPVRPPDHLRSSHSAAGRFF